MGVADRQSMWKSGFNPLDYCFISRAHCGITTDINIQHTTDVGMEAVFMQLPNSTDTGDLIFGHAGNTTSHNDNYDFRFFIAGGTTHDFYIDRANGRASIGGLTSAVWHKIYFEGRSAAYIDNTQLTINSTPTYNSNSSLACFFSFPWKDNSQNDVAVRYVRLYNISSQQDIVFFVPDPAGMRDLVTGNVYAPQSSSAQFEVVKWKELGVNMNEGLALILLVIDETSWKEAA